jgi:hypothetical protein
LMQDPVHFFVIQNIAPKPNRPGLLP